MITDGKFLDTNVVFDIIYSERKRHKKSLQFYQNFKNLELRVSGKVLIEIGELLNSSLTALVLRIRDSIKHLELSGRRWDDLQLSQRRKVLIEFENDINNDKKLIKMNQMEFVLNGFRKLENIILKYNFEEIQEALLSVADDLSEEVFSKVNSLFSPVYLDHDKVDSKQIEYSKKIDSKVISRFFNNLSSSKDKDIVMELLFYLGFGAKDENFRQIVLYTMDSGFEKNYLNFKNSKNECENYCEQEISNFLKSTCSNLYVEIAY
jgi:hypothetical protein